LGVEKGSTLVQRVSAEFIGTFCLVFCGCGAIMVAERFPVSLPGPAIALAFGLAVGVMIYALGHVSGAHFNPAVTLGFASVGRCPWNIARWYWLAQFSAALAAIALLDLALPGGAGFGATLPKAGLLASLAWEAVLTFFLMFVILAVATDPRVPADFAGLAIGATVTLDALVGGPVSGASMNPARSLAPALWQGTASSLWIYFLGPAAGAVAAAQAYEVLR
jgi:aquaporin NIP